MSKRSTFANTWVNQTELGKHFGISAVAVGKKLAELGLRGADRQPTEKAVAEGFCRSTPLKDGTPFFLWNKKKVSALLRSSGAQQLSQEDAEAYETARELIALDKEANETGIDKLFYIFLDEISTKDYPRINHWLGQLGSKIRLGE
ncbi:MAG TPA: hypothetical protein VH590_20420 [Ktedonobacterales bacterium]